MQFDRIHQVGRSAAPCLFGAVALVPVTLIGFYFHLGLASASLLYVMVVVFTSMKGSFVSSTVVSLLAVGCLDYFFTIPLLTLGMNDLQSYVAMTVFLTTSLIVTRLVYRVRKQAEEALSSVSYRVVEAEEQERHRIAAELHEDIGQRLSLVAIKIEQLEKDPRNPILDASSPMEGLWKQNLEILNDVIALAHELYSPRLQYLGIAGVMSSFCREFGDRKKVGIDFNSEGLPSFVPPEITLCLFRVLQAALHNAVQHSGVSQFDIQLNATSDEIRLAVSDCGVGFDLKTAKTSRGLGLNHMQERLKLVKGSLSIDSQPKRGTRIHARVPLSSERDTMRVAR